MEDRQMIPTTGQRFGPYEILGRLGRGGMGVVFRAWDARLHREVAVKLLHTEQSRTVTRERFMQEARAASALNHPNICTIFDIGNKDGEPYLVMELMHGETLRARIDHSPIPVDDIVTYACEILDALGAAHARGIVHRDIKPPNIYLVDKPTGGCQIKVLDFGLAKLDHAVHGLPVARGEAMTSEGATVGTVAYMSPEQARGEPLDHRTDLFSLGVVMYEMATRRTPFQGSTTALMFLQLLQREPEPLRDWNDAIPKDLEKIILTLLRKDPRERYQSAAEVAAAIAQMTSKGSGSWLKRMAAAVPLVRAADPVARERRPMRRSSDAHLSRREPGSGKVLTGAEKSVLRPVVRLPERRSPSGGEDRTSVVVKVDAQAPILQDGDAAGDGEARNQDAGSSARIDSSAAAPVPQDISSGARHRERAAPDPRVGEAEAGLDPTPATASRRDSDSSPAKAEAPIPLYRTARKRRRRNRIVGWTLALAAVSVGGFFLAESRIFRAPLLNRNDKLLVTSIENLTGDRALDETVAEAIDIELEESSYLATRGLSVYRSGLRQIGSIAGGTTTPVLARQAAQAAGAKAYLYGTIRTSGANYVLTIDVLDATTNRKLTGMEDTATSRERIPQAVDRIAEFLRSELGEDGDSMAKADVPLAREATSNIDALHAYAVAREATVEGRATDAIAAYNAASAFDPKFVQPQMQLAWQFRSEHAEMEAATAARQAQANAGATSPHVALYAKYTYQVNALADLDQAANTIRQFIAAYPHDAEGDLGLARILRVQGKFAEALDLSQRALAEEPSDSDPYGQAEYALLGLDRYDAALGLEETSRKVSLSHDSLGLTAAYLAGKEDRLAAYTDQVIRPPHKLNSIAAYGLYLDNSGQVAAGWNLWRAAAAELQPKGPIVSEAAWLLAQGALDRGLNGNCRDALELARAADTGPPGMTRSFNVGIAAALCGDTVLANKSAAEMKSAFPESWLVNNYYLADLSAASALGSRQPQMALDALKTARAFDLVSLTPYLRGLAHLALHQDQIAIVDFETVLGHRGVAVTGGSNVYPMAQIALARAFAQSGDKGNSVQAYRRFLEIWKGSAPSDPLRLEAVAGMKP